MKFLQEEATARKRQLRSSQGNGRLQQGEAAQGAGKGVDGEVPAEPQETDMAEAGAGEQQEQLEARGARLFFVLNREFYDVMVTGEKHVEYRKVGGRWDKQLKNERGRFKTFDYVEFQCAYSHPLYRFRAGFAGVSIVDEHSQTWSNGAEVAFKDQPTYAIRLGRLMGAPYLVPPKDKKAVGPASTKKKAGGKEKKAVGPATPKKRVRSVGLDSPATGRKCRQESGRGSRRGAVIIPK